MLVIASMFSNADELQANTNSEKLGAVGEVASSELPSQRECTVTTSSSGDTKPVVTLSPPPSKEDISLDVNDAQMAGTMTVPTVRKKRKVSFQELEFTPKEDQDQQLMKSRSCEEFLSTKQDQPWKKPGRKEGTNLSPKFLALPTDSRFRKKRTSSGSLNRQDSFLKRFSTRQQAVIKKSASIDHERGEIEDDDQFGNLIHFTKEVKRTITGVVTSDSNLYCYWLTLLTAAILYNIWTCIVRECFPQLQQNFQRLWFIMDGICDGIYIVDFFVQTRTGYLEQGIVVYDSKKLARHYFLSRSFIFDVISIIPLDLLQIWTSSMHPLLRFNRFLKMYRAWSLYYIVESRTMYPNTWRVVNLIHFLLLLAHWFAGFYYAISVAEEFSGRWTYPHPNGVFSSLSRKYLACLYWSTLTLTTIGDLPPPESNWEYVFTICSYLIGVFIFATIVGQVGNIITNRNASRLEFERLLDGAKQYMRNHNVPVEMQRRVQRWYIYSWSRGRMSIGGGGGDIHSLGLLPDKLKTELALHVNLNTLKKVTIFQECQPEFLHDLVLKMKAFIFTPGDLICRKGEVAREMFIIADGILEVIGEDGSVLRQMRAGDFFGEIGILNLDGANNRRSADVRSVGYSELFSLSREDVLSAMLDYPEAEAIITEYGRERLRSASPSHCKPPSRDSSKKHSLAATIKKPMSLKKTQEKAEPRRKVSTGLRAAIGMRQPTGGTSSGAKPSVPKTLTCPRIVVESEAIPSPVTNLLGVRINQPMSDWEPGHVPKQDKTTEVSSSDIDEPASGSDPDESTENRHLMPSTEIASLEGDALRRQQGSERRNEWNDSGLRWRKSVAISDSIVLKPVAGSNELLYENSDSFNHCHTDGGNKQEYQSYVAAVDTDTLAEEIIGFSKEVLHEKLDSMIGSYKTRLHELLDENHHKDRLIKMLETQIRELQPDSETGSLTDSITNLSD